MRTIYLDNAATTRVDSKVFCEMEQHFLTGYGNPSEPHTLGREARRAVESSREKITQFLGTKGGEIIFTSSATESINLTHKGLIEALAADDRRKKKPHIITTSIEHKAVIETCRHLIKDGKADITFLPVDKYGKVQLDIVSKSIRSETVLVSIMYANNEVGTIEPVCEIGGLIQKVNESGRNNRIYFHTDATQAIQYLNCKVEFLGVDFLSFSGHKIHAPKGIGVLYVRKGTPIARQIDGGRQEFGLRAGTENVPYIIGIAKAVELIKKHGVHGLKRIKSLRDRLIGGVLDISGTKLTGHPDDRVSHIASFVIRGIEGEAMVLLLSDLGVIVSSGSACASSDLAPSHVLSEMGISPEVIHGSLRFSLSYDTTSKEIDYVIEMLPKVIKKLRRMAPVIR